MSNISTDDIFDVAADYLLMFAVLGAFGWFFVVTGYQIYHWLQYAEWKPLPFSVALEYVGFRLASLENPDSWKGLAQIVRWVLWLPLSVMVGLVAILLAALVRGWVRAQAS